MIKQLKKKNLSIKVKNNTLKCVIECDTTIHFLPANSIGRFLGFTPQIIQANKKRSSNLPVSILKINALRVKCNINSGAYNGKKNHMIHEFFPALPPGYKNIEIPSQVIYLPVTVKSIDHYNYV